MTEDQLQTLIAALRPQPGQNVNGDPAHAAGAAAVVGQMPPCRLGKDKLKRYKKWKDWIADAETKMSFLAMTTDERKLNFIRSCGGTELTEFWQKEAFIRFSAIPADPDSGTAAQPAHTYQELLQETKTTILNLVSRDRAIIDLLRLEQGHKSFMEFLAEVEDQEYLCRTDEKRLTGNDLKRMSLIAGMKDRTLAEKAIAENFNLQKVIQSGINRETSRSNAEAMQARPTTQVSRIAKHTPEFEDVEARIQHLQSELEEVKMIRKHGKYSTRHTPNENRRQPQSKCHKCTFQHAYGRCPADDRTCYTCGQKGHLSRSTLCKGQKPRYSTTRRVEDKHSPYSSDSEEEQGVARIVSTREWPGVASDAHTTTSIHFVQHHQGDRQSKRVPIDIGGKPVELYCDTGSRLTIIPPDLYDYRMGKIVPA